jgi:riboflavin biosynthesis pyrimidine reductase
VWIIASRSFSPMKGVPPRVRKERGRPVIAPEPLETLFDEAAGDVVPLGPVLSALYGPLRLAAHPDRPHVFANFVASVDGVVALDPPRGTGADVSGGDARDRAVMGILRAVADAVVIGAGNLRAEGDHVWTAERICPELAPEFAALRAALGKPPAPLQVVVTGAGDVDLSRAVFAGVAPFLVVTTAAGAARVAAQRADVPVAVPKGAPGWIPLRAVLEAAGLGPGAQVLVESGPTSTSRYLEEGAVDELYLTASPFLLGRGGGTRALGLVEGRSFSPGSHPLRLVSARRGGSFLFLRYATAPRTRLEAG